LWAVLDEDVFDMHKYAWLIVFFHVLSAVDSTAENGRIEDVSFVAVCDGTEQRYAIRWPDGFDGKESHDLLIALHGHGSDRWQFMKDPRDECRAARDVAERHGMVYVCPDYRAKTSWMGPKAESDLKQILEELKRKYVIRKVFLCGGSMGATASLTFAALHPEMVDGVAAMNGAGNLLEYEGFQEAIAESFGGTKRQIPLEYKERSAEYFPERLTMPLGLTAGGKDEIVPPQSVARLASVLNKLGRDVLLIYRENGGHETNYEDACAILDFLIGKVLPGSVAPSITNGK